MVLEKTFDSYYFHLYSLILIFFIMLCNMK